MNSGETMRIPFTLPVWDGFSGSAPLAEEEFELAGGGRGVATYHKLLLLLILLSCRIREKAGKREMNRRLSEAVEAAAASFFIRTSWPHHHRHHYHRCRRRRLTVSTWLTAPFR